MRACDRIIGIFSLVLSLTSALTKHAPLEWPVNGSITATNVTGVPTNFPYVIEGCGMYTGNLVAVLMNAVSALAPALKDVGNGVHSQHGFKALFKDGATSTYVRGILRSIASAQPLKGLQPNPSAPSAPRFACVTPWTIFEYNSFVKADPWIFCNQPNGGAAFYLGGSSYIFLCPSFWRGRFAPQKESCPSVRQNQFVGGGEALGTYLTYVTIHEMVHFYLGKASLGPYTYPPEVYPINDCVALKSLDSVHNPQNYQFYVAMTEQGCTEFPDPDRPPFSTDPGKGSLLLVDAANPQPTLATGTQKPRNMTTNSVLESRRDGPDDILD